MIFLGLAQNRIATTNLGYEHSRLWTFSVMNILGYELSRLWAFSVMIFSVMNILGYEHSRLWTFSVMNILGYEHSRLWFSRLWSFSVMIILGYDLLGYEFSVMIISVMIFSVMIGNRKNCTIYYPWLWKMSILMPFFKLWKLNKSWYDPVIKD